MHRLWSLLPAPDKKGEGILHSVLCISIHSAEEKGRSEEEPFAQIQNLFKETKGKDEKIETKRNGLKGHCQTKKVL